MLKLNTPLKARDLGFGMLWLSAGLNMFPCYRVGITAVFVTGDWLL